jgi:hypothetical protein
MLVLRAFALTRNVDIAVRRECNGSLTFVVISMF